MKIFGFSATRSARAVWAAEEVGADYEYASVDLLRGEGRRAPYVELNPGGKVPTLVDGDLVLTESAAIVTYLGDRYPKAGLTPPCGSAARAQYDRWCYFVIGELEQPLWTITKHKYAIPEKWRVPQIVDTALWEFSSSLAVLAQGLGASLYILGARFSGADVLMGHTLAWARNLTVPIGHDSLRAYCERVLARPAFARAQRRESAR